jgi:hypothetical protein
LGKIKWPLDFHVLSGIKWPPNSHVHLRKGESGSHPIPMFFLKEENQMATQLS